MEPDSVPPECPMGIGQERDPERHAVFRHAQGQRSLMLTPDCNGWTQQGTVYFLVVASGDLPSQRAFELTERHRREAPGFVALASARIGEGRSWIEMHAPHHRADQPLDVPAIMGSAYGSKDQFDALFAARPSEGVAAEIGTVVRMHGLGQSSGWPRRVDLTLLQPGTFVVNGVQHAQSEGDARRLIHRQMKSDDHTGEHVDGEGQPWSLV